MYFIFQVKEDNAEISTMEQQIAEIQDHINRIQEEHTQLDQVLGIGSTLSLNVCRYMEWVRQR